MMKAPRLALLCLLFSTVSWAQGTRTWEQTSYEEFEKGTAHGVAVSSDGMLTLAPAFDGLFTSPSSYIWGLASDAQGNVYAAAGSPARVYKLAPDGKASIIFAAQELQVQALVVDTSGVIYAATSPDGKVYKIVRGGAGPAKAMEQGTAAATAGQEGAKPSVSAENALRSVAVDPGYSSSIFFDPKTKYIWALALDHDGRLYIGTGDRGQVFRVDRNGKGAPFFTSDEAHIRALDFDNAGNLIAGTDGSGLLYRISPRGEGFVLYSAPKKEITALAVDAQGTVYAAGVGEKRGTGVPAPGIGTPAPSAGTVVTLGPPGSVGTPAASPTLIVVPPNLANLGGSEVYRISSDGSPKTIWSSPEDLVYALDFDQAGRLLAGTGNRGKIYVIRGNDYADLAQASANQVTAFAPAPKGGVYVAASNLGKVFLLGSSPVAEGTFASDVFDAKNFSKWGRIEVRGRGNFDLFARSGNVDNPDRNWSAWKKVDLQQELPIDAPSARFIQWKAVLRPGSPAPALDSVTVNYLPKNVAPEVDEVTVLVGSRIPAGTHTTTGAEASGFEAPLPVIHDKHSIVVKWKAHDDNGDTLTYDVFYRGDGEAQWKLLHDGVDDRYVNLDADMFPDGGYTVRVVASDAPSHSPDDALTGERVSAHFEVDNTPPRIESLTAKVEGTQLHLTFRAVDSFSPIRRAEYSIDAGDWQLIEPVGQISDYRTENYDFRVPVPPADNDSENPKSATSGKSASSMASNEHTVVLRVYDRFENVAVSKTVVKASASGARP